MKPGKICSISSSPDIDGYRAPERYNEINDSGRFKRFESDLQSSLWIDRYASSVSASAWVKLGSSLFFVAMRTW